MKTKFVTALVISAALAACGGKAKQSNTPANKAGASQTDVKASGSTGGASYGGQMAAPPAGGGGTADPCSGGK